MYELASLGIWADLSTFRGPGFYFSLLKIAVSVGLYFSWVGAAEWVGRDAPDSHMDGDIWNPIVLGCGLFALVLLWAIPVFPLGALICALLLGGCPLVYVFMRNPRVPEDRRVLTPAHFKRLAQERFKVKFKEPVHVEVETKPKWEMRFFSRGNDGMEEDRTALARAESSRGYKAALQMVWDALQRRATDIHLEPTREEMSVRFRIDGIMHAGEAFPRAVGDSVVNIFKVLCKMDITEKRKPQDGSFSAEVDGRQVDFRVATAGSVAGEKLVMRILDKSSQIVSLKQLGMRDKLKDSVRNVVRLPHGMMIVCGPTGSGKSTTLYACLNEIDRLQLNVITIENPVEYQLANTTQIEVNVKAGKTFASELRSILRQDPDVIMVGEIRDKETAEIACQAAQTGHMVFTTLHANDTVTAVGRLIDLGVQPFMLASAVTSVLGQRLVRVLCPKCKVRYKPNPELLQRLRLPPEKIKFFFRPPGAGGEGEGDSDAEAAPNTCEHCLSTGYLGRTGIFELLLLNDALRGMIREKPNLGEIKLEAVKNGMRYLYEDGLMQVIEGRTSIQEVLRVSK